MEFEVVAGGIAQETKGGNQGQGSQPDDQNGPGVKRREDLFMGRVGSLAQEVTLLAMG